MEIKVLARQGHSIKAIARELGLSRNTVRKYLRDAGLPHYKPRPPRAYKLDPFKDYLQARAEAARPHWMFSEAVAATALRKLPSDAGTRPALACRAVLTSAAIGELPAAPVVQAAPGGHTPESLLTAAIVWLLTARADSAEEELRLLDMAAALCRSIPAEPRDPADTDKLNARLRMLAQHL